MDQRERVGDLETGLRAVVDGALAELWTAMPGIVQSFNPAQMTCVVQPAIKALLRTATGQVLQTTQISTILDVPVVFTGAGGLLMTMPLTQGDEVLVVFSARCIDAWWQNSGVNVQQELRMHDMADGFAIPGIKSIPNVPPGISTTSCQIRTADGTAYIELTKDGVVNIVAPNGVNITTSAGPIALNSPDQGVNVDGSAVITGGIIATEDGVFDGISVDEHIHSGVTTGSGDTGQPV